MAKTRKTPKASTERLLDALATAIGAGGRPHSRSVDAHELAQLRSADLVEVGGDGRLALTSSGRAHRARAAAERAGAPIDKFRAQHLRLGTRRLGGESGEDGASTVMTDHAESPLVWLARRKGHDGRSYVGPAQLQAGERFRLDFTQAQLMPRTTSNWTALGARGGHGGAAVHPSDAVVAARQRMHHALDALGPEFSGLLVDVCCFLKRLEDVERERRWPPRSAKVVLQLGLDRLARHYGLAERARGRDRAPVRTWMAPGAASAIAAAEPPG